MSEYVVLTGAGRGLGRALARRLAERGKTLLACTASPNSLASLQEEFSSPHHVALVDVSDDAAVEAWAGEHIGERRIPKWIINNAAVMNESAELWRVPPDEFHRLINVNVCGVYHVIRHWLPPMLDAAESGVVVNYSSTWGRTASPRVAPYCASKFAIEGLTQALAKELPRGFAAVALNPGVIDTDMLRTCFGGAASMYPDAEAWSHRAIDCILSLGPEDNGKSLSVD